MTLRGPHFSSPSAAGVGKLVGPHADGVIEVSGLAIRHKLAAEDLKATMLAYPTGASDIAYTL